MRIALGLSLLAGLLLVNPARAAAQTVVTLDLTGSGAGTVTSSPAGLNCSGSAQTCTGTFAPNAAVTLTATPSAGQTFGGWSGACQGTGPCSFVTATGLLLAATFQGPPAYVFYHQDVIGSVRAVTNEAGAEVARYDYEPFGEAQAAPGGPIRFGGKELDEETQFYYFGARFQRNILGRFTTDDPAMNTGKAVLEPQRWNRYAYALNNPLKYVDPDGKDPLLILGAIGGVVYGGWQVVQNLHQGNAWYENVGSEGLKGMLVGVTLGAAAAVVTPAAAATGGAVAATAGRTAVSHTDRWADAATEMTTLYRAVSDAEAISIRATGKLTLGPNSLGGKWFAETLEHAKKWGDLLNGKGASRILEVRLPRSIADQLMRTDRLDGIGPARYGELWQLEEAMIRELP